MVVRQFEILGDQFGPLSDGHVEGPAAPIHDRVTAVRELR